MAAVPQANPVPDKPPLHLRGGCLIIAAPADPTEACLAAPAIRALRNGRPQATIAIVTPPRSPRFGNGKRTSTTSFPILIAPRPRKSSRRSSKLKWSMNLRSLGIHPTPRKPSRNYGSHQRFGYRLTKLSPHLNETLEFTQPFGPPQHRVHYYMSLVEKLGVKTMVPENFQTPERPTGRASPALPSPPARSLGCLSVATGTLPRGGRTHALLQVGSGRPRPWCLRSGSPRTRPPSGRSSHACRRFARACPAPRYSRQLHHAPRQ